MDTPTNPRRALGSKAGRWVVASCGLTLLAACSEPHVSGPTHFMPAATAPPSAFTQVPFDVDRFGLPVFIDRDYIDVGQIDRVSRFRSSVGRDYTDALESCRSMKHYFVPKSGVDWAAVPVFAPAAAKIVAVQPEPPGATVQLRSRDFPAFTLMLSHVALRTLLREGDDVEAGQTLGTHAGGPAWSDIAVSIETPRGKRLVSYFEVMTPVRFQAYRDRGLIWTDIVISAAQRDADPLTCRGETFVSEGHLPSWVSLGN